MASSKVQTGLRIKEQLYEKARALAVREQRSLNNLVEYALQKYIDEYEREHGEIPLPEDFISG